MLLSSTFRYIHDVGLLHLTTSYSLIACLALVALPALHAGTDDAPAILSATVDYAANRVTVTGSNFSPSGVTPIVSLQSSTLSVLSFTNQSAAASLPVDWASGSYLLAVTNSNHQTGVYQIAFWAPPINKLRYHAKAIYGIFPLAGTLAYAGLLQELNAPREWGDGAAAYGRRVASTEAGAVIHSVLAFGLDTTLHQDPRYFRSDRKGFFRRIAHAARGTVLTHRDAGGETFSTWRMGSAYGEAFLSNLWYPDRLDTVRLGFLQGSLRVGFDLVSNLSSEFWPDIKKKLRRQN
ncbi:MAG TPA: hypothetical protein VN924_31330 [Bryobacteraceae bacterium]|nr:hypothetical protein [Bryobacteraceae bacterium]